MNAAASTKRRQHQFYINFMKTPKDEVKRHFGILQFPNGSEVEPYALKHGRGYAE